MLWLLEGRDGPRAGARMVLVGGSDSHVSVPLRRGEVAAQLLGRATGAVTGGVALDPPSLRERLELDDVEAERVGQLGDDRSRVRVVPRDDEGAATGRAGRLSLLGEVARVDVVERLDDARRRQVALQELRGRRRLVVELEPLSEGWRIQRDTPGYGPRRTADELRADVAAAKRYRDM